MDQDKTMSDFIETAKEQLSEVPLWKEILGTPLEREAFESSCD
ncbi:hypothetical protein ACFSCX_02890 [Bacillus salitolerans]|uniref:Uncharacterized protein n=1 Tax=Bacillus salitolerans TaxID=1437434 RepID=A0ABW4LKR0_9BACI